MNDTIVADTPEKINMFRLLSLKAGLKLEVLGMQHSRQSAYSIVKKELGFKGDKIQVLSQLVAYIEEKKAQNNS